VSDMAFIFEAGGYNHPKTACNQHTPQTYFWKDKARRMIEGEKLSIIETNDYHGSLSKLDRLVREVRSKSYKDDFENYPTLDEFRANVEASENLLKIENRARMVSRLSCGKQSCKCTKAKLPQECHLCGNKLQERDCITSEPGPWVHTRCFLNTESPAHNARVAMRPHESLPPPAMKRRKKNANEEEALLRQTLIMSMNENDARAKAEVIDLTIEIIDLT
jgi:hypothetical protein